MDSLIDIRGISKHFGPITAVDDVSFSVARGEVLGFLGPNGAGKTTTMRIVTGYLPPNAGSASVCGFDVVGDPIEVKRRVGYLPEGAPAYGDMTPQGLLRFVGDLRGLAGSERKARIDAVVERLQLGSVLHRPIETLSKGFKRRVGLAQAILADPEVLILDEPTDGLDPNQKHEVRQLLTEMAPGKAIVISTHILEEVEAVCSRAIIVSEGRIVADSTPEELQARSHVHNAVALFLPAENEAGARAVLDGLAVVASVEPLYTANGVAALRAYPAKGQEILSTVQDAVVGAGIHIEEIYLERGRLDEVFRMLTVG